MRMIFIKVNVCKNCNSYLIKKELPKYSLINNLYMGSTPEELKGLTCVEETLISRYRVKCNIYSIELNTNKLNQRK